MNTSMKPVTEPLNAVTFLNVLAKAHEELKNGIDRYVALIDLHRFKAVNDIHGHQAGDHVLRVVSKRIVDVLQNDGQLGRLGGDHFAILFERSTTRACVEKTLENIISRIKESVAIKTSKVYIGCSIGAAEWTARYDTGEILRQLNKAVQFEKSLRQGKVSWYSLRLERDAVERVLIEPELREAVASSSIEPWFQPIFELNSLKLKGFEVLARWSNSSHGKVAPGRFIQTAEHCNLIDELSMSVFDKACGVAQRIDRELSISFNISPIQFQRDSFEQEILEVIKGNDFDPRRLTLEITESSVIQNLGDAKKKLDSLRKIGIEIALDDFGTGYSSLTNLGHLPIDRIKINRSFIIDIATKPHNQKIVKGIISLANGLGVAVTIEGIETPSDLAFAQRHGSFLGQGFLFDRALPADQVEHFLRSKWPNGYIGRSVTPISAPLGSNAKPA